MAKIERPTPFGRYELLRRIGAGGMGEVFLARLPGLGGADKLCVVKKILPHLLDDRGFVARFVDEGKVVIHLSHGNIAQVFEMGDVEGEFFMAMEYVEGKTLAKVQTRVRERGPEPFPIELALFIGIRLLDGLAYAHRKADPTGRPLNVVHRDISPSNVMLTYDGDLKIIDFGAALSTFKEEMTAPRVVIGNLTYMAPEHARKQHVDARADLFSTGAVLWELISWQQLPTDGDHIERWKRAARPNFEKASEMRPGTPRDVDLILAKALQVDLRERYQDAERFRDDLQIALARMAPTTTQRTLVDYLRLHFDEERREERRLIADVLNQPAPVDSRRLIPAARDEQADNTDPEMKRAPPAVSDRTPLANPPGEESTGPGAPPPPTGKPPGRTLSKAGLDAASLAASMRSTLPGRPALFGDEDGAAGLEEPTAAMGSLAEAMLARSKPAPPVASGPSPVESTDPHGAEVAHREPPPPERPRSPTQNRPKARAAPIPAPVSLLWVVVGATLGFLVVVALLSLTARH
jgi:serine/threonine protein kinase